MQSEIGNIELVLHHVLVDRRFILTIEGGLVVSEVAEAEVVEVEEDRAAEYREYSVISVMDSDTRLLSVEQFAMGLQGPVGGPIRVVVRTVLTRDTHRTASKELLRRDTSRRLTKVIRSSTRHKASKFTSKGAGQGTSSRVETGVGIIRNPWSAGSAGRITWLRSAPIDLGQPTDRRV